MGRRKKPPPVVKLEVEYVLADRSRGEQAIALFALMYRNHLMRRPGYRRLPQ